ncbi:SH3 domain-containing protein [Auraticoccus monumenti]|uniref:Uncharacterized conserved protein YgiM, contains N-terminal SH3 domain, DUF1202 family n=1 Tax=Auraticoccus monumenti TaxID=675864 RepID=A0A1G6WD39_9ACTN|nr:SH3 domain-containing protein [Auraticoccus monumenti]SDD62975.1 Uncharacterized conserved protein YgiM, contains N-terminal SH3 domain, DUF1202 family [Auraticoccus monumenti]
MNSALKRMGGVAASLVMTAGLVSGISVVVSSTAEARTTMVTATTSVNVRSGPGTRYRVVGALGTGQSLPVKGQAEDGWTQVGFAGTTAWVSSRYVVAGGGDDAAADAKASRGWRYGTTALNVRTGPSLSAAVVTVAAKGYGFQVTGETRGGYTEVNFKGKVRWVTSQYLTEKKPGSGSSAPARTEWRYGTVPLNVRTGPSSSARVVDVAGTGYGFELHGTTRDGFAEVTFKGSTRWVSARYLSKTEPTTSKPAAGKPQGKEEWRYGTVALNIRTGPSLSASVIDVAVRGYGFTTDGTTRSGFTEVTFKGKKRWVSARYLTSKKPAGATSPAPSDKLPEVVGHKYATTALDIRSASRNSTTYSEVPRGTKLAVTGKVENGRAQIIHNGAVRWVTAQYLSSTRPGTGAGGSGGGSSSGLSGLTSNSTYLLARLQARYPQVSTYYGVRADPIPDHPSGRALDAMLPSYSSASGRALGWDMAEWIKDNARELNVEYIIYDQRIWNVRRAGEGWRYMADRGSDNANHKNHVHITTLR